MKIVTYNIWNVDENIGKRLKLLCSTLCEHSPDVVCMQEVRNSDDVDIIKRNCGFNYSVWKQYYDWQEGLAILSRYPIIYYETSWEEGRDTHNSFAMRSIVNVNGVNIGITNLHLDYKSALSREIEIVETVKMIEKNKDCLYEFMAGDFNDYPGSSIYRYITGQQSINGNAAKWIDLSESYACITGKKPEVTLDFLGNPRWDGENILELPGRFDWIMLKSPYPVENPRLNYFGIIGNKKVEGITPSDHYGAICDITW